MYIQDANNGKFAPVTDRERSGLFRNIVAYSTHTEQWMGTKYTVPYLFQHSYEQANLLIPYEIWVPDQSPIHGNLKFIQLALNDLIIDANRRPIFNSGGNSVLVEGENGHQSSWLNKYQRNDLINPMIQIAAGMEGLRKNGIKIPRILLATTNAHIVQRIYSTETKPTNSEINQLSLQVEANLVNVNNLLGLSLITDYSEVDYVRGKDGVYSVDPL
jgi:hypothetical protein